MRHLVSHVPGTGNWMQQVQYQQWMNSANEGASRVKAVPGAGKSVIAAQLVSPLHEDEGVRVLHFFFRQIVTQNCTSDSSLRDWVASRSTLARSNCQARRLPLILTNTHASSKVLGASGHGQCSFNVRFNVVHSNVVHLGSSGY